MKKRLANTLTRAEINYFTAKRLQGFGYVILDLKIFAAFDNLVAGSWSEWENWSVCSVTCGSGLRERTRSCDNPKPSNGGADCVGEALESEACNKEKCRAGLCFSISSLFLIFFEVTKDETFIEQITCNMKY